MFISTTFVLQNMKTFNASSIDCNWILISR